MKIFIQLILVTSFVIEGNAQSLQWRTLPGAPFNNIKLDDFYFVNETTGWVIDGLNVNPRRIYKTTNGGYNWIEQFSVNSGFRCISFSDIQNGWVGSLTPSQLMFRTTNSGQLWTQVLNIPPGPNGICGIIALDENNIFACGRYDGPAHFIKTTNGGSNWTVKNLAPLATSIVDIHFLNQDTGFVTGGLGVPIYTNAKTVVLSTYDGGETWTTVYSGNHLSEWGWKISFTNQQTGYVSVESYRFEDSVSYVKTTDGGVTWNEHRFGIDTNIYHSQSIIFKDENTGWIGGFYQPQGGMVSDGPVYETLNGGANWYPVSWGANINRFRKINDSLIYASGRTVYKYSTDSTVNISFSSEFLPDKFLLHQNYPNPFNPSTKINFAIPKQSFVSLKVYNIMGREVATLVNENLNAGFYEYQFTTDEYQLPSGVYFYRLESDEFREVRRMILIR